MEKILINKNNIIKEYRNKNISELEEILKYAEIGKISCQLFHDILNPITGLTLYLNNINKIKNIDSDLINYLKPTFESTEKISSFIRIIQNDLHNPNKTEEISLNATIIEAMQLVFQKAKMFDVSIIFIQKQNIILNCSKLNFYQIIINLLTNAIDAYEKIKDNRKRKIILIIDKNKDYIILKIKDNAIGIKNNINIFKPLYTTKKHGFGIGLPHVKNIIENKFNGKIEYKSELNKGTEFNILIPFKNH